MMIMAEITLILVETDPLSNPARGLATSTTVRAPGSNSQTARTVRLLKIDRKTATRRETVNLKVSKDLEQR